MPSLKAKQRLVKGLCLGYPGSAKTGSLASLINSGRYNVRILDFDGNYDPLYEYVKPEFYDKVEIKTFEDKLKMGVDRIIPNGSPRAFELGMKLLDSWKYTDKDTGEVVDLGPISSWGPDDVLVLDTLTAMGRAALRHTLDKAGRSGKPAQIQDWGVAMDKQDMCVQMLMNSSVKCHVLVMAHLKLIGPPKEEAKDSDETKDMKHEIQSIIPHRLYPSALGQELPPRIAADFPFVLLYRSKTIGSKTRRTILTKAQKDVDVKVPLASIDAELPVETGLLTLFEQVEGKKLHFKNPYWGQAQKAFMVTFSLFKEDYLD